MRRLLVCTGLAALLLLGACAKRSDDVRVRQLRAEIAQVEKDIDFYVNSELDATELQNRLVELQAELAELEPQKE